MRILVAHSRYRSAAPSGENIVVDQETAGLGAAGHEVELFERHSDDIADWSLARKATLPARTVWSREVKRSLTARLAAFRPDVVHVHNTFPLLSPSVLYACRDVGVPVVATIHNYRLLCPGGGFFRDGEPCHDCSTTLGVAALRHGCYRSSRLATAPVVAANLVHRPAWQRLVSAYIFISQSQKGLMSGLALPEERIFVKHNSVDVIEARSGPVDHLVTYVGRLDTAKGISVLMGAWDDYRMRYPGSGLRLAMVGGGPLDDVVRAWAERHPSVELFGLLPREQVLRLLRRSLAGVVTSKSEETFGLVAVEAMACGAVPIAPRMGPFPELITDRVDGVLFDAGDAAALARAFAEVDRDPGRFDELGRRSRSTYELRFQPEANVERLLEIYRYAKAHPIGGGARAASTVA